MNGLFDFSPSPLEQEYQGGDHYATTLALYNARNNPEDVSKYGQQNLANAEHESFMRGLIKENPWMTPSMLLGIPAYDMGKRLGLVPGRSSPGIDQMAAGYRGMWRGLFE